MARYLKIDAKDTPKDIHLLGNCLGMRYRKTFKRGRRELYKPYRNYFEARIYSRDWMDMEKRGLVDLIATEPSRNVQVWAATPSGRKYIGKYFGVDVLKPET